MLYSLATGQGHLQTVQDQKDYSRGDGAANGYDVDEEYNDDGNAVTAAAIFCKMLIFAMSFYDGGDDFPYGVDNYDDDKEVDDI